jgi:hypothetical protein
VFTTNDERDWFAEPEIMFYALTYLGGRERIREPCQ